MNLPASRLFVMSALFALNVATGLAYIFTEDSLWSQLHDIFYPIYAAVAFAFSFYILFNVARVTNWELPATFQSITVLILSISFIIDLLKVWIETFRILGIVAQLVGMLFFIVSFLIKLDYLYLLPINIQDILIYSADGPCLFRIGS